MLLGLASVSLFSMQLDTNKEIGQYHSDSSKLFTGGAPTAKTGAPGEGNCTQCHAGSVVDGSNQNIFKVFDGGNEVSAYMPGVTYQVSLSLATGNVKEGFGATALLENDEAAGSIPGTGLIGTQTSNAGGRNYITHRVASSSEGNISWDWDWTAPSTESGPVTFYVASNKANGNGSSSGDQIFVSQHVLQSVLSVDENESDNFNLSVWYNKKSNSLKLDFATLSSEFCFLNVINLSGKSVFTKQLGYSEIGLNEHWVNLENGIESGIYIVQLFIGNRAETKKIKV